MEVGSCFISLVGILGLLSGEEALLYSDMYCPIQFQVTNMGSLEVELEGRHEVRS